MGLHIKFEQFPLGEGRDTPGRPHPLTKDSWKSGFCNRNEVPAGPVQCQLPGLSNALPSLSHYKDGQRKQRRLQEISRRS